MSKVKEIILRAGEVLRLTDEVDFERIPKYKLIYRNDMRIALGRTEISVDNGIFHYDEKFEEDNREILEKAGAYLDELFEEAEEGEYEYGEQWIQCDEKAVRESTGVFVRTENNEIYQFDCFDLADFYRFGELPDNFGYLCIEMAHRHGVRLEAFREVPNNYYLFYGIKFDDWTPRRACYYLYDGYDISVGDFDIVIPYGKNNTLCLGYVSSKQYFSYDEVPIPIKKMKHIIGYVGQCSVYSAKQLYFLKDKRVCVHLKSGEIIDARCLISAKKNRGEWKYSVPLSVGYQVVDIGSYEIDYIEYLEDGVWRYVGCEEHRKETEKRRITRDELRKFWHKKVLVVCKNGKEYVGKYIWYNSYYTNEPYPESIEIIIDGYRKENIYLQDIKEIRLDE